MSDQQTIKMSVQYPTYWYQGRFKNQATKMVNEGIRIGMMWVHPESEHLECHVCDHQFKSPELDPIHKDLFDKCPNCSLPFLKE